MVQNLVYFSLGRGNNTNLNGGNNNGSSSSISCWSPIRIAYCRAVILSFVFLVLNAITTRTYFIAFRQQTCEERESVIDSVSQIKAHRYPYDMLTTPFSSLIKDLFILHSNVESSTVK
jgi:hypothetical protein